jgi:hypothetical protein
VCYAQGSVFVACSLACLEQHQLEHGPLRSARERAQSLLADMNARHPDSRASFAPHRARLMDLIGDGGEAESLGVFGAGNASDLELDWLTERFAAVHLIDLDGAALERARACVPTSRRERVVLHPDVDLSGLLDQLDPWGEAFPVARELGAHAVASARALVHQLGRFDVTLSTCVLSQLGLPFRRAWVAPASTWANLSAAVTAVHLATLAGCTGRRGVLAFDVQVSGGVVTPEPRAVLAQLGAPGLKAFVSEPKLLEPWAWNLGDEELQVFAIEFAGAGARPAASDPA